jgi:hypothetical protein
VAVIAVIIVIRLVAGGVDQDRIRRYIRERGGYVRHIEWTPFGRGWFGDQSNRIYTIRYVDGEGNEHHASCKTSVLSGVYLTEDRIARRAAPPKEQPPDDIAPPYVNDELSSLREENQRLRDEIERLRGRS